MRKILIADRGVMAARVIQACRDEGIESVAVYAGSDLFSVHSQSANEAYELSGATSAEGYLDGDQILAAATRAGADAIHPGGGAFGQDAGFAGVVTRAGLTWIGPSPKALERLNDLDRLRARAAECGVGMASRDGARGERSTARRIEVPCLVDRAQRVVTVSTRDASLRTPAQTLIAEAPARGLSAAQEGLLRRTAVAVLRDAGYVGAATCSFEVDQDSISLLGVTAGVPVEHQVTEEVTGLDLVREQLRLARGELLGDDDPTPVGHALHLRIDARDAVSGFGAEAGAVTRVVPSLGPGVRLDLGVQAGSQVEPGTDPLLAGLVVRGNDRKQMLERARRAVGQLILDGLPTLIAFHQAVLDGPWLRDASAPVGTAWLEEHLDSLGLRPQTEAVSQDALLPARETLVLEIGGRRVEVTVPCGRGPGGRSLRRTRERRGPRITSSQALASPMHGTVRQVAVKEGDRVVAGDLIAVIEAMEMEQHIAAHRHGLIQQVHISEGDQIGRDAAVCVIVGDA
ncbi:biotin carboxylase N-terminal domain-containing protein [Luteipulveratus mongoliensis]|uniref:biotin carboxylase n=1 Tax=Luteipulveratus mongoliensis TaxID=571913 RepID=A0A0K1JPZ2_9MICO|nr:biotin carboxylase N-terminal domain-containing protein [Luteipulveratus mongoliensis]AKU18668.1 hypothetical protein VV02_05805 [Luteipulveratus mongoliensis]